MAITKLELTGPVQRTLWSGQLPSWMDSITTTSGIRYSARPGTQLKRLDRLTNSGEIPTPDET